MSNEKIEFGKWWMWIVLLIIVTGGLFAAFKPAFLNWEHKAFINSHQYQESKKSQERTFDAQLEILEAKLRDPNLTESDKVGIRAQINSIKILSQQ